MQGEVLMNPHIHIIDSILEVKACGSAADISADLSLESTKTIAELLDDQKEPEEEENNKKEKDHQEEARPE
jgi:hypothetical protein